ncbi:hypothetical protein ABZ401_19180 [Streptomyces sp. NPDC005892]|uniref:hypothetical protein n=1 Tax=Streptomyces sp. NPDC005892 TaxID=3155593 RepID=UPI0033CD5F76
MTPIDTITADSLIAQYADGIAFVAEEQPATELTGFIYQLTYAAENLDRAGLYSDDLTSAATYLAGGDEATDDTERTVLLGKAAEHLLNGSNFIDEYRDMC